VLVGWRLLVKQSPQGGIDGRRARVLDQTQMEYEKAPRVIGGAALAPIDRLPR